MKPLAIDLFCGLGGWTEGLLAEGFDVIGFDIEKHHYGDAKYPAQLVIQDVLTIHGSQFKDAALIVASPPCQEYSYMAMPWTKAKEKARKIKASADEYKRLTALFDACFRIQREAREAAGRNIPLVVENVKGAQPWVGRSRWNFGSFHLWGDVPALMPIAQKRGVKVTTMGAGWYPPDHPKHVRGLGFNTHAERAIKNNGGSWFAIGGPGQKVTNANPVHGIANAEREREPQGLGHRRQDASSARQSRPCETLVRQQSPQAGVRDDRQNPHGSISAHSTDLLSGTKQGGDWFSTPGSISRTTSGRSAARKAASAKIAMIPLPLSRHIARVYHP